MFEFATARSVFAEARSFIALQEKVFDCLLHGKNWSAINGDLERRWTTFAQHAASSLSDDRAIRRHKN